MVNYSDTISMPPGYQRALRWATAYELAAEFGKLDQAQLAIVKAKADETAVAIFGLNRANLGQPNTVEPEMPAAPAAPPQAA